MKDERTLAVYVQTGSDLLLNSGEVKEKGGAKTFTSPFSYPRALKGLFVKKEA